MNSTDAGGAGVGAGGGGGLVKKLLFPSFADAGASDAFRPSPVRSAPTPAPPTAAAASGARPPRRSPRASPQASPRGSPPPPQDRPQGGWAPRRGAGVPAAADGRSDVASAAAGRDDSDGSPAPALARTGREAEESMLNHTGATSDETATPAEGETSAEAPSSGASFSVDEDENSPFGKLRQEARVAVAAPPPPTPGPALRSPPRMMRKASGVRSPRQALSPKLSSEAPVAPSEIASVSVSITTATSGVSSVLGYRFLESESGSAVDVASEVSTNLMNNTTERSEQREQQQQPIQNQEDEDVEEKPRISNAATGQAATEADSARVAGSAPAPDTDAEREVELSMENLSILDASHEESCAITDAQREDSDEANSMTSHMGSDPGERKLRLDEVNTMSSLAEGDEGTNGNEAPDEVINGETGAMGKDVVKSNTKDDAGVTEKLSNTDSKDDLALPVLGVPQKPGGQGPRRHGAPQPKDRPAAPPASPRNPSPIDAVSAGVSAALRRLGGSPRTPGGSTPQRSPAAAAIGGSTAGGKHALSPRFSASRAPGAYRRTSPPLPERSQPGDGPAQDLVSAHQGSRGSQPSNASTGGGTGADAHRVPARASDASPPPSPSPSVGDAGRTNLSQSPTMPQSKLLRQSLSWGSERTPSRQQRHHRQRHHPTSSPTPTSSAFRFTGPGAVTRSPKAAGPERAGLGSNRRARTGSGAGTARGHTVGHPVAAQRQGGAGASPSSESGGPGVFRGVSEQPHCRTEPPRNNHSGDNLTGSGRAGGNHAVALQAAQCIDLEREDALDLLTCLVERSVAFHEKTDINSCITDEKKEDVADSRGSNRSQTQKGKPISREGKQQAGGGTETNVQTRKGIRSEDEMPPPPHPPPETTPSLASSAESEQSDLYSAVDALRRISRDQHGHSKETGGTDVDGPDHAARMRAVDELLRSHTYALEMERAALSASAWLRAIGRIEGDGLGASAMDTVVQRGVDEISPVDVADVISLRAQLRAAEGKAKEKDEQLSKCRAEIGRLKSASRAEALYVSPNKSIFDIEDDDDVSESSASLNSDSGLGKLETALQDVSAIGDVSVETPEDEDDRLPSSRKKMDGDLLGSSEAEDGKQDLLAAVEAKKEAVLIKAKKLAETKGINNVGDAPDVNLERSGPQGDHIMSIASDGSKLKSSDKVIERKEEIDKLDPGSGNDDVDASSADTGARGAADMLREMQKAPALALGISDPLLEKQLEEYACALREADKAEIERLQKLLKDAADTGQKGKKSASVSDLPGNSDQRTINVRMLDGENFVTEWDELAPLPPPPDHGLRSPIVEALLTQWTSDRSMHDSLLSWMDRVLDGEDPSTIPPLKISSLDHQLRDGFAMHVLPLLLRRSDVHIEVTSRAHRRTSYDMAVSVTSAGARGCGTVSYGDQRLGRNMDNMNTNASARSTNSMHMMAFKASRGCNSVVDEVQPVRNRVSEFLTGGPNRSLETGGSGSAANSSVITSRASNRLLVGNHTEPLQERGQSHGGPGRIMPVNGDYPAGIAVGSPSGADEYSVGSSITGASSHRSTQQLHQQQQQQHQQQSGLMSALGGAFGGLLSRRKAESASPRKMMYDDDSWGESPPLCESHEHHDSHSMNQNFNGASPRHAQGVSPLPPQQHPSQTPNFQEEEQPYHRVVSAPPGRIGITFVQYRGHAMVSDVSPESPLSGWIFPSDILIAIDEIPVSGLRVREIVKILTTRKERQRALRVISSHAMTELTHAPSAMIDS